MAAHKRSVEEDIISAKKHRNENVTSVESQQVNIGHYTGNYYSTYNQVCEHRGNWMSLYDSASGHFYYQNTKTYQTQWEKPSNWDNLPPVFNPWIKIKPSINAPKPVEQTVARVFKSLTSEEIEDKLDKLMKRPARRQVDPDEKSKEHWIPEGSTEYNIWYDKWVGENWHSDGGPAETRCCIDDDAGFTTATIMDPKASKHYFCLYFARGCCHLGSECSFLHSIPRDKDERRIGLAVDCFGRERHLHHKDNLGGVGSFEKDCTTLYIGGLSNRKAVERQLWEEFGEWGEIEDIRVISKKNIAFVRYKNRLNAEFAKIAMADQRLGDRDVLNVRWANDDPNPKAQKKDLEDAKEKLFEAAHEKGIIQELEARPETLPGGEGVTAQYPDTGSQYSDHEYWSWYNKTVGDDNQQYYQHYPHQYSQYYEQYTQHGTHQPYEESTSLEEAQENFSRLDRILKQMESKDNSSQSKQSFSSHNGDSEPEKYNEHTETIMIGSERETGREGHTTLQSCIDKTKDPYRN